SRAHRDRPPQLAVPPRPPNRRVRPDSRALPDRMNALSDDASKDCRRMPAEWEPHRATWIAWPHFEPDWPGKLAPISWAYGEIARGLADYEPVEILCHSEEARASAQMILLAHAVRMDRVRLHIVPTDRSWLRDSGPTGVFDGDGNLSLVNWAFNGW